MMYARIIDDQIIALNDVSGYEQTDASVQNLWSVVPDAAQTGWRLVDGVWLAPEPVAEPEPVDLDGLKTMLAAEVDAERDRRTDAGFAFQGVRYQSRPSDRENIAGAAVAALGAMVAGAQPGDLRWHGADSDFTWIAEDNSLTPMDAQTVYAFGQAAMAHKQGLIFAARAIKDAVMAAEDADAARTAAIWP